METVKVSKEVLSKPAYAVFTLATAFVALTAFVLPGNISLVNTVVLFGDAPLGARLAVLADLYPFFGQTVGTSILLTATALLIGVNLSVLINGWKRGNIGGAGGSAAGTTLATLGAGCAACGSALLAAVFSVTSVAGALTVLPFEGTEFVLIALAVILLSTYWTVDATREGCRI